MDHLPELTRVKRQVNNWFEENSKKVIEHGRIRDALDSEKTRIYHHELLFKTVERDKIIKLQLEDKVLEGHCTTDILEPSRPAAESERKDRFSLASRPTRDGRRAALHGHWVHRIDQAAANSTVDVFLFLMFDGPREQPLTQARISSDQGTNTQCQTYCPEKPWAT